MQHVPYWIYGCSGAHTPWYPSMRLFRQGRDLDWGPVFAAAAEALRDEVIPWADDGFHHPPTVKPDRSMRCID